jgi:predicted MFS family arabinose efflux permease
LGLSPAIIGGIVAVGGVSNLAGALAAERAGKKWPVGRVLIFASLSYGISGALVPLASGGWQMSALILAVSQLGDFAHPIFSIHELSLRQSLTSPEYLGRVNACMQMLYKGLWPVGALLGGYLASVIGIRATLGVAAAGIIASTLILELSPVRAVRSTRPDRDA